MDPNMDGAQSQGRQRPYPRASSRSSTHTTASRMTSVSVNSSTSHAATSPQPSQSHSAHRYHHTRCSTGSPQPMSRPTPPLSRQESTESTRQPALSSFLQEKLQRERKAESEKLNHSQSSLPRSNPDVSASLAVSGSPSKAGTLDGSRPQSTTGLDQGKKKGLGVNQMEQVISNLHKQNFDLKLELYHRRERQTTLEERVDTLENDNQRLEDINDKLLIELEKRDKAVEEAVAMIVTLEARVEQLFRERIMVQQVESEGFFCPRDYEMGYKIPISHNGLPDVTKMEGEPKVVNRMPSFLSDHNEETENLRNVYLKSKASVLSLTRVAEGSPEADNMRNLASPTLSILSESSFVSIYGRKERVEEMNQTVSDADETLVMDCANSDPVKQADEHQTPRGQGRSTSFRMAGGNRVSSAGQFQSISDVINGSPLQQLERLDRSASRKETGSRSQRKDLPKVQFFSDNRPPGPRDLQSENRESLRKVAMDAPGGVRLHENHLPPTPDTISSSTLQRCKGQSSNDTLSQEHKLDSDNSNGVALDPGSNDGAQTDSRSGAYSDASGQANGWAAPDKPTVESLFAHRNPLISRPRSADESTISQRRANDWDSDDDSDTRSLQSSLDIWMRESAKASPKERRASPDLFSFPTRAMQGSWAMAPALGSKAGHAELSQPPPGFDYMRDLFSLRQGLFTDVAPPPPGRRSSLHARTGSTSEVSSQAPISQGDERTPWRAARRRSHHSRQNSVDLSRKDGKRTPVQKDQISSTPQPSSDQKQKHYPPLSGQHYGAARTGLNRLFRRSTSGAPTTPTSENASNTANPEVPPKDNAKEYAPMGIPSWTSRSGAVEEDMTSATPPPIMFNARQVRRNTIGVECERPSVEDLSRCKMPGPVAPAADANFDTAEVESSPAPAASGTGARRKWLPAFTRASSLKNKTG